MNADAELPRRRDIGTWLPLRLGRSLQLVLVLLAGWFSSRALAATPDAAGSAPVVLPAFVVNEDLDSPRWRYIGQRNYEILFRTPDHIAAEFSYRLAIALDAMEALIPPSARLRLNTPLTFIFDQEETASVAVPGGFRTLFSDRAAAQGSRIADHAELRLGIADQDVYIHYLSIGRRTVSDFYYLVSDLYLPLLKKSYPRPPSWLTLGVEQALQFSTLSPSESSRRTQLLELVGKRVVPLDEMPRLLARLEASTAATRIEAQEIRVVGAQSALLANWALFAEGGKYRAAFWDFYQRSARDPDGAEALFEKCLGLSHSDALARSVEFLAKANHEVHAEFWGADRKIPRAGIRDATPAEIARITGEWARMAAPAFPMGKDQLMAAAGRILDRGLERVSPRDPQLLAATGIQRAATGRDAEARPWLEAAAQAGVARPQAYLELARIRLAAAKAAPEANDKLSAVQFADVMKLLRHAKAQSDQQENYYELLVTLWEHAAHKPARDELAPLAECANIFTRRPDLTLRSAQLHAALGYADEARTLSKTALRWAKDEKVRAALVSLSESDTAVSKE